jgi:hypothetical protein
MASTSWRDTAGPGINSSCNKAADPYPPVLVCWWGGETTERAIQPCAVRRCRGWLRLFHDGKGVIRQLDGFRCFRAGSFLLEHEFVRFSMGTRFFVPLLWTSTLCLQRRGFKW